MSTTTTLETITETETATTPDNRIIAVTTTVTELPSGAWQWNGHRTDRGDCGGQLVGRRERAIEAASDWARIALWSIENR